MKNTKLVACHIKVELDQGWTVSRDPTKERQALVDKAREVDALITQHLGPHVYRLRTEIVEENEETCSHCGAIWTEEDANYNGGCCDSDESDAHVSTIKPVGEEQGT